MVSPLYQSIISSNNSSGLFLQHQDVRSYLLQRTHWHRLVEVAREADLIACLEAGCLVVLGVGSVGQHLMAQEAIDTSVEQPDV